MEMVSGTLGKDLTYVNAVKEAEEFLEKFPQVEIKTEHKIHGGMYSRTIMIPEGVMLTGAEIQIPTILIISGDVTVHMNTTVRLKGYCVMSGVAGRKQLFFANKDTYMTMLFPTSATTVEEAEKEFTKETEKLLSNKQGDKECQEPLQQFMLPLLP